MWLGAQGNSKRVSPRRQFVMQVDVPRKCVRSHWAYIVCFIDVLLRFYLFLLDFMFYFTGSGFFWLCREFVFNMMKQRLAVKVLVAQIKCVHYSLTISIKFEFPQDLCYSIPFFLWNLPWYKYRNKIQTCMLFQIRGCIATPAIQLRDELLHKLVASNLWNSGSGPDNMWLSGSELFCHIWVIFIPQPFNHWEHHVFVTVSIFTEMSGDRGVFIFEFQFDNRDMFIYSITNTSGTFTYIMSATITSFTGNEVDNIIWMVSFCSCVFHQCVCWCIV